MKDTGEGEASHEIPTEYSTMDTGEGEASHEFPTKYSTMDTGEGEASHEFPTKYSTMDTGEGEASHAGDNGEGLLSQIQCVINNCKVGNSSSAPKNDNSQNGHRCIYRCPEEFKKKLNGEYLEPQVVAIGPYHHRDPKLRMTQRVKQQCVRYFLKNNEENYLQKCLEEICPLEEQLKQYYDSSSETIPNEEYFLQMMVIDGCFILDLFLNFENELLEVKEKEMPSNHQKEETSDHPLFLLKSNERILVSKIYGDLLLLENQIPSIVLEKLYENCRQRRRDESLSSVAIKVFDRSMLAIDPFLIDCRPAPKWWHLLDLVRSLFIPQDPHDHTERLDRWMFAIFSPIPCVTKLRHAGIKIKWNMYDSLLEMKFKRGVIEMPFIALDHDMCSMLANCVAFEQCHGCFTHFSIYATILDGLVNTDEDIEYLCDRRVIAHSFGTDHDAAVFINNLGKGLTTYNDYDNNTSYLFEFSRDVNGYYYRKRIHRGKWMWRKWRSFKHEYSSKPWMLISAFVAFVLLVLTFLQTFYTIYAYHVHPKN